jgi:subtilisin family serine protease
MMKRFLYFAAMISALLMTSSCGGGGGSSSSSSSGTSSYSISGKALSSPGNSALAGVTITISGGAAAVRTTGSDGTYSFTGLQNGSYTLTPSLTGYTFSPVTRQLTIFRANVAGQDFSGVHSTAPVIQSTSVTVKVMGLAPSSASGTITATDPQGLALAYSITGMPALGTATINPGTGAFTYTISGHTQATSDSFTVTASNGTSQSSAQVQVQLGSDALLQNQWHIQNVGQNSFASVLPVAGNDMNVSGAWTAGYSGMGIKVGIADTGLEAAHEDLAANVDLGNSYNFLTGLNDPSRARTDPGFDHGTSVAGIIGAAGFNGKGGRGVAYNARLRGYNLLASGAFSLANMAKSLGSDPISSDNDLFNASFGTAVPALPTFSGAYQAITGNTLTLRNGLGASIVNAAGNDFDDWDSYPGTGLCIKANQFQVSCGDPANDERRGGYAPILVGALDADGKHSSYSNTGSSLWISAPGGDTGLNAAYTTGSSYGPAIITTSRTGCANSLYSNAVNLLDSKGAYPFATSCQYTAIMNGTSSATPNVAGVVAMMLEANPSLSVRDLKYILAKTAKRTDPTFSGVSTNAMVAGSIVVLEQGWTTNGAGWTFSNRYGFGAVDAAAAVAMAKTYTSYLPAVIDSSFYQYLFPAPATVPAQSLKGRSAVFHVSESLSTVEFVVVFLNIDSTPGLQCNQVELTSPSGTKSILMHAANGFANTNVVNSRILSNAFYGEPANGDWTLTFFDFCTPGPVSTVLSTVNPQQIGIVGH